MTYASAPKPRGRRSMPCLMTAASIAGCLLLLPACSTSTPAVRPCSNQWLLQPRPIPAFQGLTWRELSDYVLRLYEAAAAAEADKRAALQQCPEADTDVDPG